MRDVPGLRCATCAGSLYPGLARRAEDGFHHAGPCRRRTARPCRQCGTVGRRTGELCKQCAEGSPTALDGGQWVPRRGVVRWQVAS